MRPKIAAIHNRDVNENHKTYTIREGYLFNCITQKYKKNSSPHLHAIEIREDDCNVVGNYIKGVEKY